MAKKNEKFDSFLKRTLEPKVYQQVKISDPCIVQSKKQNYVYRYVFLTDDALYITENPPKSILFIFPFCQLKDVQLIHDTAKFLQKELQDIAQHILIKSVPSDQLSNGVNQNGSSSRPGSQASPRNTIWKNLVSSFNKTQTMGRTGLGFESPADDEARGSSDGGSESDCGFEFYNSASCKRATGVVTDAYPHINIADDAMSVASYNGSSTSESPSPSLNNRTVTDPLHIEILGKDKPAAVDDVHLYILNETSSFFLMLQAVWKAYLLSSTYQLDSAEDAKQPQVKLPKPIYSKAVLDGLRNDIIASFHQRVPIEQVYRYFLELKSMVKDNLNCKAYFWKDRELYATIVHFLSKFSSSNNHQHLARSDEIECMILICETLAEMLKQTEALAVCHDAMNSFRREWYETLVACLLRQPAVSSVMLLDEEMQSLLREYAVIASEVLYELIIVAERMSLFNRKKPNLIFTTSFLFTLINSESSLLSFLKRVVKSCVQIWTENDKLNDSFRLSLPRSSSTVGSPEFHMLPLTPQDVVRIYQSFVVIYRCFVKCNNVKDLIQHNFTEEFKYYIRSEVLEYKIPASYPAAGITRNIVSGVASLVLENGASN